MNIIDAKSPSSSVRKKKTKISNRFSSYNLPKIRLIQDRVRLYRRRRFNDSNIRLIETIILKNHNARCD